MSLELRMRPSHGAFLCLLLLPVTALAQANLTPITSTNRQHLDARISADGNTVAFRVGNQSLGTVGVISRVENILFTSAASTINSFIWDRTSSTLFFSDGGTIRSIARSGGQSINLGTIAGSNVGLWGHSLSGSDLFGTRQAANGTSHIFTMPSNGQGGATDIVPALGVIDEVRLDASGGFLMFRNWSGQPFTQVQYFKHDLNGPTGTTSVYIGDPSGSDGVHSGYWLDNGQTVGFTTLSPNITQQHLGRAGPSGMLEMLTDFQYFTRRSYVRSGSGWILCETLAPDGAGLAVAVMPTVGGGQVLLEGGRPFWFNPGSNNAFGHGLSMDGSDARVAVSLGTSASDPTPQIYIASLDREIRVHPRVVTGGAFRIDLPVNASEIGAVAVAFGLSSIGPLMVPPITGFFMLDPSPGAFTTVVSGVGTGTGPLVGNFGVPANPGLQGLRLFFQGVRLDLALSGSFTRWGHFVVH